MKGMQVNWVGARWTTQKKILPGGRSQSFILFFIKSTMMDPQVMNISWILTTEHMPTSQRQPTSHVFFTSHTWWPQPWRFKAVVVVSGPRKTWRDAGFGVADEAETLPAEIFSSWDPWHRWLRQEIYGNIAWKNCIQFGGSKYKCECIGFFREILR